MVNIIAADKLFQSPKVYSTFLLWLRAELYEQLPEVGDLEKAKLVFFFDQAHLLFNDAPRALMEKSEQVVRLIRSKGVGVFFISQNPLGIPNIVLGQLGNRVQHALRAYTLRDQKAVRAAAETFRVNPELNTEQVISELGVGEALVAFLDEKGVPGIMQRAFVLPPHGQLGPITSEQRQQIIAQSLVARQYERATDRESAYEKLKARAQSRAAFWARCSVAPHTDAEPRSKSMSSKDPIASALGGLLGALLSGAAQARSQPPQTEPPPDLVLGSISESEKPTRAQPTRTQPAPTMDDMLGSLLGGGSTQARGGEDALGSLLGSLLGGGAPAPQPRGSAPASRSRKSAPAPQASAGEDALGSLLGSLLGGGAPASQSRGGEDALGSLLGSLLGGETPPASQRKRVPAQRQASAGTDVLGTLLSGLLGVDTSAGARGIATNPITNAFVAQIAEALARKTGIAPGIAQVVVVFAINALLSGLAPQQGGRQRFNRDELIHKLSSGKPITQTYLKQSGLLPALVEETGLSQKAAAQSLQQVFQALGTQMGEGTLEEHQQELQTFLRKWK